MRKILILGFSDLSQRKIIPILQNLNYVEEIEIASKSKIISKNNKVKKTYFDYDTALKETSADLIYISLPNSQHYKYCKESILLNKSVIVDKPAVLSSAELNSLKSLMLKKNQFITQSCVFQYHKAWDEFVDISKKHTPGTLNLTFHIPKLDETNFRMSKDFGGGCLNDMGIYATEASRLFWGDNPNSYKIFKNFNSKNLDINFHGEASYGKNAITKFNFSFNSNYKNFAKFESGNFSIIYERVFSPHEDVDININITEDGLEKSVNIGFDNTFLNYFDYIFNEINQKNYDKINYQFNESVNEFLRFKEFSYEK